MPETVRAELVVVGAGPAGIAAAVRSAEAGADVVLVDEGHTVGGQIWRHGGPSRPARPARRWLRRLGRSGARLMTGTAVLDALDHGRLVAERRGERLEIEAPRVILATGARELFLPFPGWTLPGVLGVGAIQALLKSGARFEGLRAVIAGSGPLLLPVAAAAAANGARVTQLAEQAPFGAVAQFARGLWQTPARLGEALRCRLRLPRTRYRLGAWVIAARGEDRVEEAVLTDGRRSWRESCEVLGCSYGLVPNTELARLLGCAVTDDGVVVGENQQTTVEGVYGAGEATGIGGTELALVEGDIAGAAATGQLAALSALRARRARNVRRTRALEPAFRPRRELAERLESATTVCRCEDVTWNSIDPSWSLRQAKLYTRVGMGSCQGRVCGPALRFLCGWSADTVRPPLKPCAMRNLGSPAPTDSL